MPSGPLKPPSGEREAHIEQRSCGRLSPAAASTCSLSFMRRPPFLKSPPDHPTEIRASGRQREGNEAMTLA